MARRRLVRPCLLLVRAQALMWSVDHVRGHPGVPGGDVTNVSLARSDLIPADVPQAFFNRVGIPAIKSNKETMANREILGDE
jgi:hypothetical protein